VTAADERMDAELARLAMQFRADLSDLVHLTDRQRTRIAVMALQLSKDVLQVEREHFRASLDAAGIL